MDTNITKTWKIEILEDEVLARCTNESLHHSYNRMETNPRGDSLIIQPDDKSLFSVYFDMAIANLHMILARRMEEPSYNTDVTDDSSGKTITFELKMHDNHDNNVLPMLVAHCYNYVVKQVLEQWYNVNFGSELERLEINHCLHYRKHPVRRRIGPLF